MEKIHTGSHTIQVETCICHDLNKFKYSASALTKYPVYALLGAHCSYLNLDLRNQIPDLKNL